MRFHQLNAPICGAIIATVVIWGSMARETVMADQGPDLRQAVYLIESGKPNEAIELMSRMIEEMGPSLKPYMIRGAAYFETSEFAKAIQDFTHAIKLNPRCAECYYARCRAYEKLNDLQSAYDDIRQAVDIDPEQSEFYFKRGWVTMMKNPASGDSVEDFSKAMALNPSQTIRCLHAREMAYEFSGDFESALKDCMEIETLGKADTKLYFKLVSLSGFTGRAPQAEAYLEKGLASLAADETAGRTDPALYLSIGDYYWHQKDDIVKAIEYYQRGREHHPDDVLTHVQIAKAYAALHDMENALAYIDKAKAIHISAVEFIRIQIEDPAWDSIRDLDEFKALLSQE